MTYRIEIKRSARKALLALPLDVQRRMSEAIDALASDPQGPGTRKLTGSDILYRVRIGDYRLVYEAQDDRLLIFVVKVGHRRERFTAEADPMTTPAALHTTCAAPLPVYRTGHTDALVLGMADKLLGG